MNTQSSWSLIYNWFEPEEESLRESLCTLGNGYFAVRGAVNESTCSRIHYPATYIAGIYNRLKTNISGRTVFNEDMVNCPNWLFLTFRIGDSEWFSPSTSRILFYRQELDMRRGVLRKEVRFQNRMGQKTLVESERFVSMHNQHVGAIRYVITPENYSSQITVRSMIDGAVSNTGVQRYRKLNSKHLEPCSLGEIGKNGVFLDMRTTQSKINITEASKIRVFSGGNEIRIGIKHVVRRLMEGQSRIGQEFKIFVNKKQPYEIEKTAAVYTSRDEGGCDPVKKAVDLAKNIRRYKNLLSSHQNVWAGLWDKFDIKVRGSLFSQKALRLHIFHLIQTASPHNIKLDAGFPARGLHGEAYRGHIFWDEIYAMPFYDFHFPEISRSLILYRYRRLPAARKYAYKNGYKGAMFPWQSSSSGGEETQTLHLNPLSGEWGPDYSRVQRHVSFAIAYNVWKHWERVGDLEFVKHYGAELILSIAQFAASLAKYDPKDGRFHIEGVMGPDEFHEKYPKSSKPGLKDNAYTNFMAVWVLLRAKDMFELLPEDDKISLKKKLRLSEEDFILWGKITRKMALLIDEQGIIEQFSGYFGLKELDWKGYRAEYGDIHRMDRILKAEGKSPDEYKVTKQADVLMIFYLHPLSTVRQIFQRLGYPLDRNMLRKNYDYYEKRTSHGSSLSKVGHCFVAQLLGKKTESWNLFQDVLGTDINDLQQGTTPEGIHAGIMGGSIDVTMRCFAGVNVVGGKIRIAPNLPKKWDSMEMKFFYRKAWILLLITANRLTLSLLEPEDKDVKVPLDINGKQYLLSSGKDLKISLKKGVVSLFSSLVNLQK